MRRPSLFLSSPPLGNPLGHPAHSGRNATQCCSIKAVAKRWMFAASFSIGYSHGGPAVMVWGWILHSILALSIIFSMAELCSSMPVAGGLFTWSYHMGGKHRRFWCWLTGAPQLPSAQTCPATDSVSQHLLHPRIGGSMTGANVGWLNLTGWVGGTASAAYACAFVISRMVVIASGGAYSGGVSFTDPEFLGILCGEHPTNSPSPACPHRMPG